MRGYAGLAAGLAAVGALYGATLSENLGAAHDGIAYLNQIESGKDLLHPHHVLYAPLARLWLVAARSLGIEADGARVVALLSAAGGLAALALFQAALRRLGRPPAEALLATALPALSFGFWFYSVSVEVYLLPLPFLLGAFVLLLAPSATPARLCAAGALHGVATLLHQAHALFAVVVAAHVLAVPRPRSARAGAAYLASVGSLVLGGYALALAAEGPPTLAAALGFLLGHAGAPGFFEPLSPSTPLRMLIGAGRALVGGHFAFALPLRAPIERALPGQYLDDEIYLVAELGAPAAWVLLAGAALLGATLLVLLVRGLGALRRCDPAARRGAGLAGVWIATYSAFFAFWVPHNLEFWIPQSIAFWLIFAAVPRAPAALAALALCLGALNYAGSIRWLADPDRDLYRALVRPFEREARPGDLVVVGRGWILRDYAMRFTPAEVIDLVGVSGRVDDAGERAREVRAAIDGTLQRGGRVFVSGEAVRLHPSLARAVGPATARAFEDLWDPYRAGWETVPGPASPCFRIGPRQLEQRQLQGPRGERGVRAPLDAERGLRALRGRRSAAALGAERTVLAPAAERPRTGRELAGGLDPVDALDRLAAQRLELPACALGAQRLAELHEVPDQVHPLRVRMLLLDPDLVERELAVRVEPGSRGQRSPGLVVVDLVVARRTAHQPVDHAADAVAPGGIEREQDRLFDAHGLAQVERVVAAVVVREAANADRVVVRRLGAVARDGHPLVPGRLPVALEALVDPVQAGGASVAADVVIEPLQDLVHPPAQEALDALGLDGSAVDIPEAELPRAILVGAEPRMAVRLHELPREAPGALSYGASGGEAAAL
jgi:hypothetical protein